MTYLFLKLIVSTFYIPITLLSAGDTAVEQNEIFAVMKFFLLVERQVNI